MTTHERLLALEAFGIKLGLENMRTLVAALGHPERAYPTIHVAGTNGKGSVCAMTERALRASGYRTGLYTSPHLDRLEERVAVDGDPVAPALFEACAAHVLRVVDEAMADGRLDVHPTFFEVTTAIAFEVFHRARVDVAVIEVGLGGRFDATNVIGPVACAITSIAFDHERHLGTTLAAIAAEKAGIAKHGTPLVIGDLAPEARSTIAVAAEAAGAPLIDAAAVLAHATVERGVATVTCRGGYPPVRLALELGERAQDARGRARTRRCRARRPGDRRAGQIDLLEPTELDQIGLDRVQLGEQEQVRPLGEPALGPPDQLRHRPGAASGSLRPARRRAQDE